MGESWLRTVETDRATTAVVGKTLEAAIVVLFVGILTTGLHAGVVPAYERAAGEDVADRVVVAASEEIERAVPAPQSGTERHEYELERRVELPTRIASESYRVTVHGRALVLAHPDPDVEATTRLAVPASVETLTGTWRSESETVLVVESVDNERTGGDLSVRIRLVSR